MVNRKTIIFLGLIILAGVSALLGLRSYKRQMEDTQFDLSLPKEFERLQPLFTKTSPPRPGEWLAKHHEWGQTYREYTQYMHLISQNPGPKRNVICVQPLGDFTQDQRDIIDQTTNFLKAYFALPVRMLNSRPLEAMPSTAVRKTDSGTEEPLLTDYLLNEVLKPLKPDDAYILIGFVANDISPPGNWNYVFGEARVSDRIAICSLARICPVDELSKNHTQCLRRLMKITSHEVGHLFSLSHCIWYLCNMAGSNNLEEVDNHPLEFCPQCMAKLCGITGAIPTARVKYLKEIYKQNGMTEDEIFCEKMLSQLTVK